MWHSQHFGSDFEGICDWCASPFLSLACNPMLHRFSYYSISIIPCISVSVLCSILITMAHLWSSNGQPEKMHQLIEQDPSLSFEIAPEMFGHDLDLTDGWH